MRSGRSLLRDHRSSVGWPFRGEVEVLAHARSVDEIEATRGELRIVPLSMLIWSIASDLLSGAPTETADGGAP